SAAYIASEALRPSPTLSVSPSSPQAVTLKFPWDKTQTWLLTQGWHYGNNVDFAPSWATVNKWVLAAHGGVVTRLCLGPLTANLRVTNPDGTITEYAHLDKGSVPPAILGRSVSQGQMLGKVYNLAFTSTQDPCGYSTGPHLHFGLPSQTVVVDGWQANPDNTWTNATGTVKTVNSWFSSSNAIIFGLIPRLWMTTIYR
ncbi:MAG TPA: M23 family metallopeptidase, partial [Anaerolineae bacterium]